MVKLSSIQRDFIIHWGEMGEKWGINRTIAQIQGLLYLSFKPLNAEEITETLSIARSTVSVGLHELQAWGIIRVVHELGDRTDRFEIKGDVWEMFRWIVEYRKRKEVDPTLEALRESMVRMEKSNEDPLTKKKMKSMLDVFESLDSIYQQIKKLQTKKIVGIVKMRNIISKVLNLIPD
jgi:DNA-binding transcriptional regulator GbsR (MarR family)